MMVESTRAALVTGGAKRIGRDIALTLARKGFDIALHFRASGDDAQATADEIRRIGRQCEPLEADLADPAQVQALLPAAMRALPHCNLLVNNASVFDRGEFRDTTEELFERTMNVNFRAPFFLARDFARLCKTGHIINLLDAKIARTSVAYFAYTLSKKALAEFTRMAAKVLAPNIRVNGICPGPMLPPPGQSAESLQKLAATVPLGRVGDPQDIASAVAYLVDNEFITGQWLFVDGGQHLC
jgi:NAD(P)-dependent dehydrogenase (short-subunit alcohol dehydrogenase family)